MNNTKAISSTFEMALRILLLLSRVRSHTLNIMQICEIDFIAVYAADFGLLDENLHGYGEYRFSEFLARKSVVWEAVKDLVIERLLDFKLSNMGYLYKISAVGITAPYAEEYRLAVETVINAYKLSESRMLKEINQYTLRSLQEDSHE